ncbi:MULTISPECIES: hypothetical protein [Streptomyces]|uniref:Uncharacterized protein n=1 Tax=Streptomyces nymphaeiformis TaxID=2663842 RepID=A0A7W7TZU3_9ACTN|nr:hypothetical protein [Streptomyces nymphaeiformis]MBB4981015.1 hypothetical protein [Streptomyces nymphaeiformis]
MITCLTRTTAAAALALFSLTLAAPAHAEVAPAEPLILADGGGAGH